MKFMNEWEIEDAAIRYRNHDLLGPATKTLANLADWTNHNSDGWPYWSTPCRAAAKLMELIERDGTAKYHFDDDREDVTAAELKAAYTPIKAFCTRHKAPAAEIVVVPA